MEESAEVTTSPLQQSHHRKRGSSLTKRKLGTTHPAMLAENKHLARFKVHGVEDNIDNSDSEMDKTVNTSSGSGNGSDDSVEDEFATCLQPEAYGTLFRDSYYKGKLGFDSSVQDSPELRTLKLEYLKGLQWCISYYYQGCISWNWCLLIFCVSFFLVTVHVLL